MPRPRHLIRPPRPCALPPFPPQATEEDLRAAFSPAGFVWELALPRSASGRGRGFAFVGFTCKVHAERGIRLVNGQAVAGRPVAVDWAVAKSQYGTLAAGAAGGEVGAAEPAEGQGSAAQRTGIDALSDLDSDDEEAAGGAGPRMVRAGSRPSRCTAEGWDVRPVGLLRKMLRVLSALPCCSPAWRRGSLFSLPACPTACTPAKL